MFNAGDIIETTFRWRRVDGDALYLNRLRYRVVSGTMDESILTVRNDICARLFENVAAPLLNMMASNTGLDQIAFKKVGPLEGPLWEKDYDHATTNGQEGDLTNPPQQRSACINLKSYVPGRKGIGRLFVPSWPTTWTLRGQVKRDGFLDQYLVDLATGLQASLTVGGAQLQFVVCGGKPPTATAENRLRVATISSNVVFMRSRRTGQGD
jgi:hypothetical protein